MKDNNTQDITAKKENKDEAHKVSEKRYRELIELLPEVIVDLDAKGNFRYANKAACKLFGYSQKDFGNKKLNIFKLLAPEEIDRAMDNFNKVLSGKKLGMAEYTAQRKDGSTFSIIVNINNIFDNGGNATGVAGVIVDITKRKKSELKIKYLSFHDKLTGLYNRAYFEEELKRLDTDRQLPLSIIMGDLNSLKLVNDAFGYKEGDSRLINIAKVLKGSCRNEDIIARWGGDEFVILLPRTKKSDALDIIDRIEKTCKKVSSQKIPLSISLGYSIKNKSTQKIEGIIKEAENRMHKNKLFESRDISSSIISSIESSLLERNYETKDHVKQLIDTTLKLGKTARLSKKELDELVLLTTLHDIGKIAISDDILIKKRKLTKKEWKIIKKHPEIGYNIAKLSNQLSPIAEAILSHHERWDGTGYPQGIKGNKIPKISRIVAIINAYDVMVNGRVYKKAINKEEAIEELKKYSGKQFDPKLIDKFIHILEDKHKELNLFTEI